MGRTTKYNGNERWFVVSDDAVRATVEAAIRGALVAQRDRLARVYVDVVSDHDWPANVHAAVQLAERRLAADRHGDVSLTLDPRVDEDFEIAHALAPFSISCTGISPHGKLIWDVNDTGTSAAFALTPAEEDAVRSAITSVGDGADEPMLLSEHHLRQRPSATASREARHPRPSRGYHPSDGARTSTPSGWAPEPTSGMRLRRRSSHGASKPAVGSPSTRNSRKDAPRVKGSATGSSHESVPSACGSLSRSSRRSRRATGPHLPTAP